MSQLYTLLAQYTTTHVHTADIDIFSNGTWSLHDGENTQTGETEESLIQSLLVPPDPTELNASIKLMTAGKALNALLTTLSQLGYKNAVDTYKTI